MHALCDTAVWCGAAAARAGDGGGRLCATGVVVGEVRVGSVGGGVAHALRGGRGPEEAKIYGAQRAGLGKLPQEKPREKESLGIEEHAEA